MTPLAMTRALAAVLWFALASGAFAQPGPTPAPVSPREAALVDLTGYWVSIVTEDWRFRMITPPKGDYASVPLNPEGRRVADQWDPAKDEAAGQQCKSYGAPNIMRVPGRVHITWDNDKTLKVEMDSGMQTRLFRFGASEPPAAEPSWQGSSLAEWEGAAVGRGGRGGRGVQPRGGSLKVVTTHLRPGYLRKNGVPYSANAEVTEYYDRTNEPNGDSWLIVTTTVSDPQYLQMPFVTSTHFKKEADGAKWMPTPCAAR